MIEGSGSGSRGGSGSGSIPLTSGSGSGRSKNMWIRWIRIRNTATRYGFGSGSFYHQAKIVRKPWFQLFCDFLMTFLSLKNDVNVAWKNNTPGKQKNFLENSRIRIRCYSNIRIRGSGSVPQCHGFATLHDLDLDQFSSGRQHNVLVG